MWEKITENHAILTKEWQPWLMNQGSLTQALEYAAKISCVVSVLQEKWEGEDWIREVILSVDQPAIFARTVFPKNLLQYFPEFFQLKNQALGRRLFTDGTFQRGTIDVAQLETGDFLLMQIPKEIRPERAWARRSYFYSIHGSLLVNEVFLPYVATL